MKSDAELEKEWKAAQLPVKTVEPNSDFEAAVKRQYPKAYLKDGVWLVDVNGVPMEIYE